MVVYQHILEHEAFVWRSSQMGGNSLPIYEIRIVNGIKMKLLHVVFIGLFASCQSRPPRLPHLGG